MAAMVIWILGLAVSTSVLVIAAAMKLYYVHMIAAAVVAIFVALAAFNETRLAVANGANESELASLSARYSGLVWTWGALAILITYMFILSWREWWQFFIAFMLAAGISLFMAATLREDATRARDDVFLRCGRYLSIAQLVGTLAVMFGLVIDGKLWRFTKEAGLRVGSQDWAANNIFFFGALALACISVQFLQAARAGREARA